MQKCKIAKIAKYAHYAKYGKYAKLQRLLLKGGSLGGGRRRAARYANPGINFFQRLLLKGGSLEKFSKTTFKRGLTRKIFKDYF